MAKTLYTYEINVNGSPLVTDLDSRDLARQELKLVKKAGYDQAKILQKKYKLESVQQVR
jgi:hypothetical protein